MPAPLCVQSDWVEIRRSRNRGRGGRGVFARRDIPEGTMFERAPALLLPKDEVFGESTGNAALSWYVFDWNGVPKKSLVALVLGYGSIYNHSSDANATYLMDAPDVMEYYAARDIAAGEEIFINYQGEGTPSHELGFEPK
jgi:SET domain-containing protein